MNRYKTITKNLLLFLIVTASVLMVMGFDNKKQKIFDQAGLLTESQINNLESEYIRVMQKTQLDIALVTTEDDEGKTAKEYAEDFYRMYGLGYDGKGGDGIILLIDMDKREVYISTFGLAVDKIPDSRVNSMISAITPYLKDGDYAHAGRLFLDEVEGYMSQSPVEEQEVQEKEKTISQKLTAYMPYKILIAAIGGGVVILIMIIGSRSRMTVGSNTYIKDHKFDVQNSEDIYINTTVIKRKIETNNNSNNKGSSTKSGGGGGSF